VSGLRAFREAYMASDLSDPEDFEGFGARRLRYAVLWAFYESTAYRSSLHTWAHSYRLKYSLYKYVREAYSPAYRLGEFHKAHLMGGLLDPEAGDGEIVPSALPIDVPEHNQENDAAIRAAISLVWQWSNWQVRKDVLTLYGAILGDVGLKVVDDVERGKIYLSVVHPSTIKSVELDPFGNVKGYEIEESRYHPEKPGTKVTYLETADRDGSGRSVRYRTFLNDRPYAWNGEESEWEVPYGFVPMVVIKHNDVGLDWGWSELHAGRTKFHELDDLTSVLTDQVRKSVNVVWFFSGQARPKSAVSISGAGDSAERPQPGREEINALYTSNADARATAMVAPLNIGDTVEYIKLLTDRLEEDYPELRFEKLRLSQTSGETLREARKPVEEKVTQRRAAYDDAVKRAHQMAISIGGYRGIFEEFGLDSYTEGRLDHSIGKRPIFTEDPRAEIEELKLFWQTAEQAGKAGVPLTSFLELQGWTPERIAVVADNYEYSARSEAALMALQGFGAGEQAEAGEEEEEDGGSS
jgi:hypothetical protein